MPGAAAGEVKGMGSEQTTKDTPRFAALDPAVTAARLAAQRRRRTEADLAGTTREILSASKRQGRFSKRRPPVEPMS